MTTGADIQIENGNWYQLHNHITEALFQVRISGTEHAIIQFLLRQTYGYKRTKARISYAEFERYLPYGKRMIIKALNNLVDRKIVNRQEHGDRERHTWSFNKYHEQWIDDGKPIEFQFDIPPLGSERKFTTPSEQKFTSTIEQEFTRDSEQEFTTLKDNIKTDLKTTTTTTARDEAPGEVEAESRRRRRNEDPDFAKLCAAYEQEFGLLTEIISQKLNDLLAEYKSSALILDAFRAAVMNNKRKLSYVEGVLRNWRAEGRHDAQTNGKASNHQPITLDPDLYAFLEEQHAKPTTR